MPTQGLFARPDDRRLARGVLVGMLILVVGAVGYLVIKDPPVDVVVCARPVPLKIVSSTEKVKALRELAVQYNGLRRPPGTACGQVEVTVASSGVVEEILSGDPDRDPAISPADREAVAGAQVWAPSAAIWLDQLDLHRGTNYRKQPQWSLASSPLVLAMPAGVAQDLGWDVRPPTWRAAMDALRDGRVNYTQENPRTSTSGALATFRTYAAAAPADPTDNDLPSREGYVSEVQGAAKGGYQNDSVDILRGWSEGGTVPARTLIMIQEQMVRGYNAGLYSTFGNQPAMALVAVHPVGPSGPESVVAEHPFVTLDGTASEVRDIAADFYRYALGHWTPLCAAGFRGPISGAEVGCAAGEPAVTRLGLPAPSTQAAMMSGWNRLRSARRFTVAMDVSGSMTGQRLKQAADAVRDGIGRLRPTDQVEIYRFAEQAWEVRKLGPRGTDWRAQKAFEDLGESPEKSPELQKSGVYSTVDDLYERVAARHRADGESALDVLVVLSDGVEDTGPADNKPGIGDKAAKVCASWKSQGSIPVHTIHYDPGMYEPWRKAEGVRALRTFASCSGVPGSAKDASDPDLRQIFSQVLGAA